VIGRCPANPDGAARRPYHTARDVHGFSTGCYATVAVGLDPLLVLINDQEFTKTANCWGVDNNSKGTNTNRIVVFRKG
jgi:hypothetical protein